MSGGLTSYPRTGGGGGPITPVIDRLITQLLSSSNLPLQAEADQLIKLLEQALGTLSDDSLIIYGGRARDALFIARLNGALATARHMRAMEICAEAWKRRNALDSTALKARSDAALQRLALHNALGGTLTALRAIKEEVGLVAWIYEASALLGKDLAAGVVAQAMTFPNSRYVGARDASAAATLEYLECAGAYNINVLLRIVIPGASQPLVMVGEAKGGKSSFGVVKTSKYIQQLGHLAPTVSQNDILYAPSRALYMRNAVKNWKRKGVPPDYVIAREEAGKMIIDADKSLSLCYVTTRGDAALNLPIVTKRVNAQCK